MPDRAKYTQYAQQTCLDVQGILCTVTPIGKLCTMLAARVTGTRPFKGVSSICILVTQIHILSELGPWSAMVGDGLRIRA